MSKAEPSKIEVFAEQWPQVILDIAQGKSLKKSCEERDIAVSYVHEWIMADKTRTDQYNLAYTIQADYRADEVDDMASKLSDNAKDMHSAEVQAIKVAIDAKKWAAGIRNAKKYGERKTLELDTPQDPRTAKEQLDSLRKELKLVISNEQIAA